MKKSRASERIIKADDTIKRMEKYLSERTSNMAIAFIDMDGSTKLKEKSQSEWLPKICRFLETISLVVSKNHGEVIKYIGDEVFAIFPENQDEVSCLRVETFVWQCVNIFKSLGNEYSAKFALDYGSAASVQFKNSPLDYLGTAIDRCARIAKIVSPKTAFASKEFVKQTKNPNSWKMLGQFTFKGLPEKVVIYQLKGLGKTIEIENYDLYSLSTNDLIIKINELKKKFDLCVEELHHLRFK